MLVNLEFHHCSECPCTQPSQQTTSAIGKVIMIQCRSAHRSAQTRLTQMERARVCLNGDNQTVREVWSVRPSSQPESFLAHQVASTRTDDALACNGNQCRVGSANRRHQQPHLRRLPQCLPRCQQYSSGLRSFRSSWKGRLGNQPFGGSECHLHRL